MSSSTNNTDHRPVVVCVTSDDIHSNIFKKSHWTELKPLLEADTRIRLVEIHGSRIPDQYPQDIQRFIQWFPTLLLVSGSSWNKGGKLKATVFNRHDNDGCISYCIGLTANKDNVLTWLNTQLQKPLFQVQVKDNESIRTLTDQVQ